MNLSADSLHRAAEQISTATPSMDRIATAIAAFLHESDFHAADYPDQPVELTEHLHFDPRALGYGIMLGYLAGRSAGRSEQP